MNGAGASTPENQRRSEKSLKGRGEENLTAEEKTTKKCFGRRMGRTINNI